METTSPSLTTRLLRRLLIIVIAICVLWSVLWWGAAWYADERIKQALRDFGERGIELTCSQQSIVGFPATFGVSCDDVTIVSGRGQSRVQSGPLRAEALLFAPTVVSSTLAAPVRIYPSTKPVALDWEAANLRVDARIAGGFDSINLDLKAGTLQRDALRLMANELNADALPATFVDGANATDALAVRASVDGLDIKASGIPDLKGLQLKFDGQLDDGYIDLVERGLTLQEMLADGAQLQIDQLTLTIADGAALAFSGPLEIHEDGTLSGPIRIGISDAKAMARWAASIDPRWQQIVAGIGQASAGMGRSTQFGDQSMQAIEVRLDRGEIRLGFIRIGSIPPLQF